MPVFGYGRRLTRPSFKESIHHEVLKAIKDSSLILTRESRKKLVDLIEHENPVIFFIGAEKMSGDLSNELVQDKSVIEMERTLGRGVLVENIGIGIVLAFKREKGEDIKDLVSRLAKAKLNPEIKRHLRALEPINEEMASKIKMKLESVKRTERTKKKLFKAISAIRRFPMQFVTRVGRKSRPRPKPI